MQQNWKLPLASPAPVPQATRMYLSMLTLRRDAYQLWDEIDGRCRETDASRRVAARAHAISQGTLGTVCPAQLYTPLCRWALRYTL